MIAPSDQLARDHALTRHDRTLLIEAGAGSGKTAILAGRVALMLAGGIPARSIVAITFTEAAASELSTRIRSYVNMLADGGAPPPELAATLAEGLSDEQLDHLDNARDELDELTCTTIHGFCRRLVGPYPVETDSDPGAGVADPITARLILQDTVEEWLRDHLGEANDGFLVELVQHDAKQAVKLIGELAETMCDHAEVRPPQVTDLALVRQAVAVTITAFIEHVRAGRFHVAEVEAVVQDMEALLDALPTNDPKSLLRFLELGGGNVLKQDGDFKVFKLKGKYEAAAGANGCTRQQAGEAYIAAQARYAAAAEAWPALRAEAASTMLAGLMREASLAVGQYHLRKRGSALLDFNDLIHKARALLANDEAVRRALSARYRHVLVDEFQDTDPHQAEILWRLCGEADPEAPDDWTKRVLRPGALFLVGDPKQAIYRFRGADIATYVRSRDTIGAADPDALLSITTNFRSRAGVLDYVNTCFEEGLGAEGQPGFARLEARRPDRNAGPTVARLIVECDEEAKMDEARAREAGAVAELCASLLTSHTVDDGRGSSRPLRPRDIALLAPTGAGLHAYEEALEALAIPVSSQAGKTFWQRQEIQDMIALTRVLADGRDGLALLAFLRGPLVGLTDEELLDLNWQLPPDERAPGWPTRLNVNTPLEHVRHPLAHDVLERLQTLRRYAATTTPHHILAQAVEHLNIRPLLRQRHRRPERALANIQAFLELARPYRVRGLLQFAAMAESSWEDSERAVEGRADVQEDTVALVTMHASKGLEWPVVIPINTMSSPKGQENAFVDRRDMRLYRTVLGAKPRGFDEAIAREETQAGFERQRLWYVATTRAREVLIIPWVKVKDSGRRWREAVPLMVEDLSEFEVNGASARTPVVSEVIYNEQARDVFSEQAQAIAELSARRKWARPSRDEGSGDEPPEAAEAAAGMEILRFLEADTDEPLEASPQGGRLRGTVLHKLLEEVLTAELTEDPAAVESRARQLIRILGHEPSEDPAHGLAPAELAATVMRALALPEVAELRPGLEPELSVFALNELGDGREEVVVGVADAIKWAPDGTAEVVVDWKSDVRPSSRALAKYVGQVRDYLAATGAKHGLIVLATVGRCLRVSA
ncbi:MAG: UvrD-helicase domain-containing protein [Trueperaceae bacterium]|nr:UvrD-helicase domain-containing protein [Trueperaceae bacterium]